jgi:hypothetical protein
VVFLATDRSRWITGASLDATGGSLLGQGLSCSPRRARDDSYGTSPRCRNVRMHPVGGRPSAL